MVTIKISYSTDEQTSSIINNYRKQYSSCLHVMYNQTVKNIPEKQLRLNSKSLNNIELLDSWFIQSSIMEAKQLKLTNPDKLIFGGKKLFKLRLNNLITNEQFKNQRLSDLYSIGESAKKGNRKFKINQDLSTILFKPNKNSKFNLVLPKLKKNLRTCLSKLYELQEQSLITITYKLSSNYIYLSYDEKLLAEQPSKQIENRVLAIDLNPNYIGLSIVD